jgi:RNA polymerase sigma factor (sigma-70 family)
VNESTDQELLREYARNKSEAAFATLVQRHIDFVYSAARRMVIDRHLAKDVAQAVFLAAARESRKLEHIAVFSAWLHRTTRNQAAMLVRGEVRRRARENRVGTMNDGSSFDTVDIWERLSPHLDEALAQLPPEDRDALLLRFFEKKTAREIGERLGLNHEAAQKRMGRALERLRAIFAARGLTVSAGTLATAISTQAVQAAPVTLATTVAAACSAAATASVLNTTILSFMATTKLKTAALSLLTAGLTTTVLLQSRSNAHLRSELEGRRFEPIATRETAPDLSAELEALRRDRSELLRLRAEITALRQQARETAANQKQTATAERPPSKPHPDFVYSENWNYAGTDTPRRAFESFLSVLKGGDREQIASMIHWDVGWRENVTEEEKALVNKSMEDYLDMLQRAPGKIAAFNLGVPDDATNSTRAHFETMMTDGRTVRSSFEMIQENGQWKPSLRMGWSSLQNSEFFTTPVFGPEIDLDQND